MPALPEDLDALRARSLGLPVEGMDVALLRDGFAEARGPRVHRALDILAPRGTRVLAVDDGILKKLFTSTGGGLTIYQFDPSETFCYYYAHLDAYAPFLEDGTVVRKGDVIGYVGTTGNAPPDTPHLHFTVFKLSPSRRWWEGSPINPYPLFAAAGDDRRAE
jgi:murein DD-endopeptidase MepM/ murein hydrolase activator NlpD